MYVVAHGLGRNRWRGVCQVGGDLGDDSSATVPGAGAESAHKERIHEWIRPMARNVPESLVCRVDVLAKANGVGVAVSARPSRPRWHIPAVGSSASTTRAGAPRDGSEMVNRAAASQYVATTCVVSMAAIHHRHNEKQSSAWISPRPSCLSARYAA